MKKILGVLILGLLWCDISFAEDPKIKTYGGRSEIPEDAKPNEETLKYYLNRYLKEIGILTEHIAILKLQIIHINFNLI